MADTITPSWVVKLVVGFLITGALTLGVSASQKTEVNSVKLAEHDTQLNNMSKSDDEIKASILRVEAKIDRLIERPR